MIKTIYQVDSWLALFALPCFEAAPVHRDLITKGHLVGDYEMAPGEGCRPCGILKCETNHRHGFIVELPDKQLSHVGRNCGKRHFGASWARVRKSLRTAKREAAKEKAIVDIKAAIIAEINRWPSFETARIEAARTALLQFDNLPFTLRSTLESRAQQGDSSVPEWRDLTEREKQQAKFHGQKNLHRIKIERGPLRGLRGINPRTRIDFLIDQQGPALAHEANTLIERPDVDSDALTAALRRVTAFPQEIESSFKFLYDFLHDDNLKTVTYLLAAKDLGIEGLRYDASTENGYIAERRRP